MKAKTLTFTKMHGLGNDFIVIDEITESERSVRGLLPKKFPADLAKKLCDRRFGVGCDQILRLVDPHGSPAAPQATLQARMEVINQDGSVAEMCGNGIRAVALYLSRYGKPKREYRIETLAGLQIVNLEKETDVKVNMGVPTHAAQAETLKPAVSGGEFIFWEISTGNPHAVCFVSKVAEIDLEPFGRQIETHGRFPNRTNVEFVEILSRSEVKVRVWERGSGATLACGTGACASAIAAILAGHTDARVQVHLPGGKLLIEWQGKGKPVFMTGPAEEVFVGQWPLG